VESDCLERTATDAKNSNGAFLRRFRVRMLGLCDTLAVLIRLNARAKSEGFKLREGFASLSNARVFLGDYGSNAQQRPRKGKDALPTLRSTSSDKLTQQHPATSCRVCDPLKTSCTSDVRAREDQKTLLLPAAELHCRAPSALLALAAGRFLLPVMASNQGS
jgi:hypothetical protein